MDEQFNKSLDILKEMGFDINSSRQALIVSDGNIEQAANLYSSNQIIPGIYYHRKVYPNNYA